MARPLWKAVSGKAKHSLTIQSSKNTPWYSLPKYVTNLHSHKSLQTRVYSSPIHNCQNLGATGTPLDGLLDKQTAGYSVCCMQRNASQRFKKRASQL